MRGGDWQSIYCLIYGQLSSLSLNSDLVLHICRRDNSITSGKVDKRRVNYATQVVRYLNHPPDFVQLLTTLPLAVAATQLVAVHAAAAAAVFRRLLDRAVVAIFGDQLALAALDTLLTHPGHAFTCSGSQQLLLLALTRPPPP